MNWLYQFDMTTFREVNVGLHSPVLDPIFEAFSYLGLGQVQFVLCLLFLFSKKLRSLTVPLCTVILVAGIPVVHIFKGTLERDRPSNLTFALPQERLFSSSFPSGHTTTSFAVATMLVLLTRGSKWAWMGYFAVLYAFFVGFSRIYRGVHWPTDVLGGICAGIFSACLVYLFFGDPWRVPSGQRTGDS